MIAVYPGSFDPITVGHIDIIQRMSSKFEEFHILVAKSGDKEYFFSEEERVDLIKGALPKISNLKIHIGSGLTIDFAKKIKADCILRGLRAISDFEYEMAMANMNKKLAAEIETLIVFASPQHHFISSRLVKEVARHGGDLSGLVPPIVEQALMKKQE